MGPKPYYRRAADLSEFMEIMGEHGEAATCELLDAVLRGTASPSFVAQAVAKIAEWNAGIDEREAEERA